MKLWKVLRAAEISAWECGYLWSLRHPLIMAHAVRWRLELDDKHEEVAV